MTLAIRRQRDDEKQTDETSSVVRNLLVECTERSASIHSADFCCASLILRLCQPTAPIMSRAASSGVSSPPPASRAAHAPAGGIHGARGTPLLLAGPAARTRSAQAAAATPASSAAAASSSAAASAAAAAAASAPRTAEQLDRARLDARLGVLLSNPLSFTAGQVGVAVGSAHSASSIASPAASAAAAAQSYVRAHVSSEVGALEAEGQAERMQRLRGLEQELIQDDWMYA